MYLPFIQPPKPTMGPLVVSSTGSLARKFSTGTSRSFLPTEIAWPRIQRRLGGSWTGSNLVAVTLSPQGRENERGSRRKNSEPPVRNYFFWEEWRLQTHHPVGFPCTSQPNPPTFPSPRPVSYPAESFSVGTPAGLGGARNEVRFGVRGRERSS